MRYKIEFSSDARADLHAVYRYIADQAGESRALAYIDRIEIACMSLSEFPERGSRRDAVRPGLRILGFERRVVIAFSVAADRVSILRILYGGRSFGDDV